MRYNFSPSLWILIYLIFVWPYKRFNCNDYCKRSDLYNYEIVIIENDTYRYSLHYNYSMRIQRNQSQPVLSDSFKNKIDGRYKVTPRFSCSYYGYYVGHINFFEYQNDNVIEYGGSFIGIIYNYIKNYEKSESRVLDEKELLGVRRHFSIDVNGSDNAHHEIPVPAKWIKRGTLVEFEAIGEICSQYNTIETCQNATTSNTTCIWCEKGEKCIESNNQHTHGLKVNDCRAENMTTRTTEENKQHKSHWYLYVVIPLLASLFLICIGCIIWRLLLRRKRSNK
uniref:Egg protein CP391S-like protein n=1 Tax=Schistosoma mansoni TaxID=6183 RepID=A0AA82N8C3_SCHMA